MKYFLLALITIIISCNTCELEKQYISSLNDSLEVLIPKYLKLITFSPKVQVAQDIVTRYVVEANNEEKQILIEFWESFLKVPLYNKQEKQAIIESYTQLLKTSRKAKTEE